MFFMNEGGFCVHSTIKAYSSPIDQMGILDQRGLHFDNPGEALMLLSSVGYYNIINAYKEPFLDKNHDDPEHFQRGTSFSSIYNIYTFDKKLRRILQSGLEKLEIQLRQIACRAFIEQYGDEPDNQLNIQNYANIDDPDYFFSKLRSPMKNTVDEPFRHYNEKYVGVPLWVCMTHWDFGTLKIFIQSQKRVVKDSIIDEFFNEEIPAEVSMEDKKVFLNDLLTLAHRFRNRSSHGKRVYNYKPRTYDSATGVYLPVVTYQDFFHKDVLGVSRREYLTGIGQGDVFTLILMCGFSNYSDYMQELNNSTIDNLFELLHDEPLLDYYIFSAVGYNSEAMTTSVETNIERNIIYNSLNPNEKLDVYRYYNFKRLDSTIHVPTSASFPDEVINNI